MAAPTERAARKGRPAAVADRTPPRGRVDGREPTPRPVDGAATDAAWAGLDAVREDGLAALLEGAAHVTGCSGGEFGHLLLGQVAPAIPRLGPSGEATAIVATFSALAEVGPRDPLEGMLAGQMVAIHAAAMECLRRAMAGNATLEGREMNLAQANRLVRSYAALLGALDQHRGKGRQVVRVEHVTVEAGGRAIVGAVSHGKGGGRGPDDEST
jgi:hypothetical protein